MRLTENLLTDIRLWKAEEQENGYVGTSVQPGDRLPNIKGIVRPAEDMLTAEIYGEKIAQLLKITVCTPLENGCFAAFNGEDQPTHRIISVMHYTRHIEALAEKRRP